MSPVDGTSIALLDSKGFSLMQARIPQQHLSSPSASYGVAPERTVEQVPGTRPVPASVVRPRVDPGRGSISPPRGKDIPKARLRRAHSIFGIIIASLFAFYLAWTFVQAGQDVVNDQSSPVETTPD